MAGVSANSAGRLSIEIVAQIATLQRDLDKAKRMVSGASSTIAKSAKSANDNLAGIGRGAGDGVRQFSRGVAQLKAQLDPAWAATQRFRQQQELVTRAWREGAISAGQYRRQLAANAAAYRDSSQTLVGQSNAMRAGFQNAGFQISDFAVQVGGGTSAIRAASQQAPQLIQAMSMMGAGADGAKGKFATFTRFMGGPWGAAITVAVSVLGALASSYYNSAEASDTKKDATKDLTDAINELHSATVREAQSTWASIQTDIDKANSLRTRANEARAAAVAELELARARAAGARESVSPGAPGYSNMFNVGEQAKQEAEMRRIQAEIDRQNAQIKKNEETIRLQRGKQIGMQVAAQYDETAAAALRYDQALDSLNGRLRTGRINEAQYRRELEAITEARKVSEDAGKGSERRSRSRRAAISAEAKALEEAVKETERFIEALENEVERIGLDAKAIRQLEIVRAMETATTAKQREAIKRLNEEREKAILTAERQAKVEEAKKELADYGKTINALDIELQTMEMVGLERERELLRLNHQIEMTDLLVKIKAAEADGNVELADTYRQLAEAAQDANARRMQGVGIKERMAEEEDAIRRVNNQLNDMVGLLGRMGGLAEGLAGVFQGLGTGSFAGLGAIGGVVDALLSSKDRDGQIDEIAKAIGDQFGVGSAFAKTMATALQGASIGMMAGSVVGGNATRNQVGGAIGGILGGIAGDAFKGAITGIASKAFGSAIGGAIGSAVPIIGNILGGIAGNLIGGLFEKSKYGGAVLSGSGTSTFGNKGELESAAGQLGGAVSDALDKIADALGAELGDFATTIGIYKDEFRVNTTGASKVGGYKGSASQNEKLGLYNFGGDQEAAIRFAIADAIKDGAIQGLSAASEALLRSGGDIEEQLSKVLAFEGVFTELERMKDPAGAAIAALEKEFDALKAIFDEAGASADEYAKLEELRALKLAELNEQAGESAQDLTRLREMEAELMTLQGDAMGALALARELELEGMSEAERALQQQIWAAQLANEKRALEIQLMEALGNNAAALAAQREIELAATHESLRALKEQVWAAQDAAVANAELARAQEEAAETARRLADQRRTLEIQLMQATGDSAGALAAQRQDELAVMDETLRGLQEQVWAAQDAASAQAELTRVQEAAAAAAEQAAQRMQSLQLRLLEAQGNDSAALAMRRDIERAAATEAERDMLDQIYAAEDAAKKAAEAAARREQASQRAEAAAAERARIADQRAGMEVSLLRALGKETEALALQRKLELKGMDASLRGLQKQIWAAEEASAAADKFGEFSRSLREFREELIKGNQATADAYRTAQVAFMTTSALARAGDEAAIGNLQGVSNDFLSASRDRAGSFLEYQRDLSAVLRTVDDTLEYTDGQVDTAEAQLNAIEQGNAMMNSLLTETANARQEAQTERIAMKLELSEIKRRLRNAERPGGALAVTVEAA